MHEWVFFDDGLAAAVKASISAMSSASLYGRGVFTTVAISDGEPFLWKKHWLRLQDHAARLGIDLSQYEEETTKRALDIVVSANRLLSGRARITFFDDRPGSIWPNDSQGKERLLIATRDRRPVPDNFRIEMSSFRVSSVSKMAGIKSCNYLDNLLAYEEATRHGFHEAIRLNERGEVSSACMANVFWLEGEKLVTPSLTTGCLAGTTREFVLENLACQQVRAAADRVDDADAIFLTSAGLGVVRVSEFNKRKLGGANHPILELIPGNPS
jgi:branched-chain amino acid aminotransferase